MNEVMTAFAVTDTKAEAFMLPFFARTAYEAQRMFEDAANKPGTVIAEHPEDFVLYQIGAYDVSRGVLVPCEHKCLGKASDFVRKDVSNA